jgi:hypothetical protein
MEPAYRRLVLGVTLALGVLGAIPSVVLAAQPACGDTITTNTTLTADLDCSATDIDGLIVGADGIILNLNGHTITGFTGADARSGVFVADDSHVTVKNGTIENFHYGIVVEPGDDTILRNLTIHGEAADANDLGIWDYYSAHTTIHNVDIDGVYQGIYFEYSAGSVVMGNDVTADDTAYYADGTTAVLLTGNVAHAPTGFYESNSGGNRYLGNTSSGGTNGFYMDCGAYGRVTLKNNTANNNDSYGFYLSECYNDTNRAGSIVVNNVANLNDDGSGGGYGFYDYYSINSTWTYNTANDNGNDGLFFDYPGGDVIKYNVAKRNGDDGIELSNNSNGSGYYNARAVSYNTANSNDDYGIYASYPAPGRGNVARNNGTRNCVSVSCVRN